MAKFGDGGDLLKCSFCGKSQKQVKKLIAGPGVYICDECIDLCNEIIEEELSEGAEVSLDELPKPREISEFLDSYVIGQEHRRRGRRLAHAEGAHVGTDELHRVVDGEQARDLAARRVDVEADVLVGVFRLEMQQLGHHEVRHRVVDRSADEDDALLEEAGVDVESSLAAVGLLDDRRHQVVASGLHQFRGLLRLRLRFLRLLHLQLLCFEILCLWLLRF